MILTKKQLAVAHVAMTATTSTTKAARGHHNFLPECGLRLDCEAQEWCCPDSHVGKMGAYLQQPSILLASVSRIVGGSETGDVCFIRSLRFPTF